MAPELTSSKSGRNPDLELSSSETTGSHESRQELLYIHPSGHLNDRVVPTGAITSVNAVGFGKLGRYAFEVSDDEILQARVIAIDLHWNVSLPFFSRMVGHVRHLAPKTPVVVGGISAGYFAGALLADGLADHVVSGDSEPFFATLVDRLVQGIDTRGIPNVLSIGGPPVPVCARISSAEFNRLDPLTIDWFPTHNRLMRAPGWAFNAGPTISVVRGCKMRCPDCYGSSARLFGKGTLSLAPTRLEALVRQARQQAAPSLRLLIGKPPAAYLTRLFRQLARSGPHVQEDTGLNLCTPPTDEDLDLLTEAFESHVSLSVTPPDEHVPHLPPGRVAYETEAWIRVARRCAKSNRLSLDMWCATAEGTRRWKHLLTDAGVQRPKVSQSCAWQMTRPTDDDALMMREALDAFAPFWTFSAARLLIPGLSRMLAPFRHLDEIVEDPATLAPPPGRWSPFWDRAIAQWHQHRLPMMPGLSFLAIPVTGALEFRSPAVGGVSTSSAFAEAFPRQGPLRLTGNPWPLATHHDHACSMLTGAGFLPPDTDALLIAPVLDGNTQLPAAFPDGTAPDGLAGLPVRHVGLARLDVRLQTQTASVWLKSPDGETLSWGGATFVRYSKGG